MEGEGGNLVRDLYVLKYLHHNATDVSYQHVEPTLWKRSLQDGLSVPLARRDLLGGRQCDSEGSILGFVEGPTLVIDILLALTVP